MGKTYKIVADSAIPFLRGVLEPYCTVEYMEGAAINSRDARDADALLIRTRTKCDEELLVGSSVKLIATATIGYDHIDTDYCRRKGIEVATAAGSNARGVLQYVMAALSSLSKTDGWKPKDKTLGIIGVGNIGSIVRRTCTSLGFRVLCCDPPKMEADPLLGYLTLENMLPQCDIVTIHVPLTHNGKHATEGLAGERFFAMLKPGAVFINSSRGEVTDQQALKENLRTGHVSHAVIDTWRTEPDIDMELLEAAAFATPHIAGYSLQGKAMGTAMIVRAAARSLGFPLENWYPSKVTPSKEDLSLTWPELTERMPRYFDIGAETAALKSAPESFEQMRNGYDFRTEFF